MNFLTRIKNDSELSKIDTAQLPGYVDFVLDKCNYFFKKTCLKRSLVLYHFLNRNHVPVKIHVGVSKDAGEFKAHSWLTRNGEIFADATENVQNFKPIFEFGN